MLEAVDGRARSLTHESRKLKQNIPGIVLLLIIERLNSGPHSGELSSSSCFPLAWLDAYVILIWQSNSNPVLLYTLTYLFG